MHSKVESNFGKGTWLRVTLREGRKRQIRETGEQIGLPVAKIVRMRVGSLKLGNLKPREWRHLTQEEVAGLKEPSRKSGARPGKTGPRPMKRGRPGNRGRASGKDRLR